MALVGLVAFVLLAVSSPLGFVLTVAVLAVAWWLAKYRWLPRRSAQR